MNKVVSQGYNIISTFVSLLLIAACDGPFNTDTTDDNLLELSLNHSIVRIMPSAVVNLSWNDITIENFKEYIIERKTITDTAWTEVKRLEDAFRISYVDTIVDDDDLIYRVGIADVDENILWDTASISIPKTTSVIVPDEFGNIQSAFDSKLIDDGDTINVDPGIYTEKLVIAGKNVLIQSNNGFKTTIIDGSGAIHAVSITRGTIDGFTITGGAAVNKAGGGIFLQGNGVIHNCLIEGNFSTYGGGGLYILENGSVYNSIIYNNISPRGSGMYLTNTQGEIINNTIVENDIYISGDCSGLLLRNNIVYNSQPDISFADQSSQTGITIDYSLFDYNIGFDTTNILGDPKILDYVDFLLDPTSPCVNAGHPDDKYLDTDGTRNDMGAYGGQGGI